MAAAQLLVKAGLEDLRPASGATLGQALAQPLHPAELSPSGPVPSRHAVHHPARLQPVERGRGLGLQVPGQVELRVVPDLGAGGEPGIVLGGDHRSGGSQSEEGPLHQPAGVAIALDHHQQPGAGPGQRLGQAGRHRCRHSSPASPPVRDAAAATPAASPAIRAPSRALRYMCAPGRWRSDGPGRSYMVQDAHEEGR